MPNGKGVFTTGDLSLAAFLKACGFSITAVRLEGSRSIFSFNDSQELQKSVVNFVNDQPCPYPARTFLNLMRDLKGLARAAA